VLERQKQGSTTLNAEVLHLWLTISRLLALSFGEKKLTIEHWAHMKLMESKRLERLRN